MYLTQRKEDMPSRINRILIAVTALFATALVVSLINFRDISTALANSLLFALLTGAFLLWLHLGATMAERKGYDTWLGMLLVLFLNRLGFVILWLLPDRSTAMAERH
jgi:lipopolysaccharide export LptBFGC system permease protein LptF